MKEENYILINNTEDGDHYFTVFKNKTELNKILDEMLDEGQTPDDFISKENIQQNLNYNQGYILIKGEIIIPKALAEITKMGI